MRSKSSTVGGVIKWAQEIIYARCTYIQ